MAKKPATEKTQSVPESRSEPEWVVSMHAHYQKTGLFRTQDLDRVLGDPRKQVSGRPSDFALASKTLHK